MKKMNNKRQQGFGNVVVNGVTMTTDLYKTAIVRTLKENNMGWMTTPEIIRYASKNGYCEGEDYPRKAAAHPIYKILSIMMDEDIVRVLARIKRGDEWEYQLTKPNVIYRNGEQLFIVKR